MGDTAGKSREAHYAKKSSDKTAKGHSIPLPLRYINNMKRRFIAKNIFYSINISGTRINFTISPLALPLGELSAQAD